MKCPFNFQTESGRSIFTRGDVKGSVIALKTRLQIHTSIYLWFEEAYVCGVPMSNFLN